MGLTYYILIFPCSLSAIGCSIFLFLYYKYRSIRFTFGMKHVAILQFLDLLMTAINLIPFLLFSNEKEVCKVIGPTFVAFILMQTFWVSVFSNYIYKVVYLGKDKDSISLKIPFIIGILISVPTPSLILGFDCIILKEGRCSLGCNISLTIFIGVFNSLVVLICFFWSLFTGFKSFRKILNDARGSLRSMKWSLFRLIAYPFITFVCVTPSTIYYLVYSNSSAEYPWLIFSYVLVCLIGFFNSIALGFTPELKEAIKLDRTLRSQSSISLVN